MKLGPRQIPLVEWALDPMIDHWCTEDGAHGRDGKLYSECDLPRLQGQDLRPSQVNEINADLIYRLGTHLSDISESPADIASGGRLADRLSKGLSIHFKGHDPRPQPPTIATDSSPEHVPTPDPDTWIYNDGGRAAAKFKGHTGDCLCRAVAIVTGRDYAEVYDEINAACKKEYRTKGRRAPSSARMGVYRPTAKRYLEGLGFTHTATMGIGTGCKVHLRADELPAGRLLVSVSKHWTVMIDGLVHDTHDCTRKGTRCVYGYWTKAEKSTCTDEPVQ